MRKWLALSLLCLAACLVENLDVAAPSRAAAPLRWAGTSQDLRIMLAEHLARCTTPTGICPAGTAPSIAYSQEHLNRLEELHHAGLTHLIISGEDPEALTPAFANTLRTHPILSKFKYVFRVSSTLYEHYVWCKNCWNGIVADGGIPGDGGALGDHCPVELTDPTPGEGCDYNNDWVAERLAQLVAFEVANPDLFSGYYIFDEPANPNYLVEKGFQERVYSFIRDKDADKAARPVMLANLAHKDISAAELRRYASGKAQDILLLDDYADIGSTEDPEIKLDYYKYRFSKWQDAGVFNGNTAYAIYHDGVTGDGIDACTAPNTDLCYDLKIPELATLQRQAMVEVFGGQIPRNAGHGYFSYWPCPKSDTTYGIDNCPAIRDSVKEHLSHVSSAQAYLALSEPKSVEGTPRTDIVQLFSSLGRLGIARYEHQTGGFRGIFLNDYAESGYGALEWLTADISGDGRPDILQPYAESGTGHLNIIPHLATGSGFQVWNQTQTGQDAGALAWFAGRVDEDEMADVVQVRNRSGLLTLTTYPSLGTGFGAAVHFDSPAGSGAVAWLKGDINKDGRLDIFQAWNNNGTLNIITHSADGTSFKTLQGHDVATTPDAVAWLVGDVNLDGKSDILQLQECNTKLCITAHVWRADLKYFVSRPTSFTMQGLSAMRFFAGDINGDQRTDIAQFRNVGNQLEIVRHLATDGGTFLSESNSNHGQGPGAVGWLSGDVDGDTLLDVIQLWNNGGSLSAIIYRSNGAQLELLQ